MMIFFPPPSDTAKWELFSTDSNLADSIGNTVTSEH